MKEGTRGGQRGAVYVETLVAFLPVVFFFLAVWQVTDACAAHLIVKRAASAAVRAAVVVLPDNGKFYAMAPNDGLGQMTGARKDDVETAARLVLASSPHFTNTPSQVQVSGSFTSQGLVTAKVTASYQCFAGWVSLVCGATGTAAMTAEASLPYQGASYSY
jgi:hypothetical protein